MGYSYYDAKVDATGASNHGEGPAGKGGQGEERRRAPRHSVDAVISFCINHDVNWHSARATDFSSIGVSLRSHEPLKPGQHVVIVPPNLASFALHGTVRWSRQAQMSGASSVYEAGVEFADQVADIEQRLRV